MLKFDGFDQILLIPEKKFTIQNNQRWTATYFCFSK